MHEATEALPVVSRRSAADLARMGFLARYGNPLTFASYDIALRQFFGWCAEHGVDPLHVGRAQIELFSRELKATGRMDSTVAQKMNAVSGFFKYALIDELIDRNPMDHVRRIYPPNRSNTNWLDRFELSACVDTAEQIGPRHHALVCLLGLNGLRVSSALNIDIENIGGNRYERLLTIALGKTGDELVVPFIPRTNRAVDDLIGDRTIGPLFVTTTGKRLVRSYADKMIKRIAQRGGIKKRVSCHSLRHSFVTIALDNGVDIRDVMNSTGHRSANSMLRYDRTRQNPEKNATWRVGSVIAGTARARPS